MLRAVVSLSLVLILPNFAAAVLIATGNGSGNTTPPANDPGFANVGSTWVRTGSAVYLGNGWVLTDDHVGAGSTWFNGTLYPLVAGSAHQLVNPPGSTFTPMSDLLLYRINGTPNLPSIQIGASAPQFGEAVTMIGNGRDRAPSQTEWSSLDGVWTAVTPPASFSYSGFTWAATNQVRWGTNTIDGVGFPQGNGNTSNVSFSTSFSATNATPFEAIGTAGDSGGGVFAINSTTGKWELIGLMDSYTQFSGQPDSVSVFGDLTYSIQLNVYRNQILSYLTPGDLNGDSRVDIRDVTQVANNWMTTNLAGDANHDGVVNIKDVTYVAENWTIPGGGAGVSVVPEPATWAMLLSALAGAAPFALWRFSRHRSRAGCGSRSSV